MKNNGLISLILLVLCTAGIEDLHAQKPINVCEDCMNLIHTFDMNSPTDSTLWYFSFDTLQPNNLWSLGRPSKTLFASGYSGPRALVTDTLDPYPINNVSSFTFSIKNCTWWNNGGCGSYGPCNVYVATKIDSDSLLDGGTIEVSHNGSPFINLIEDSLAYIGPDPYSINDTVASLGKPGFSGSSSNWIEFGIIYWPATVGFDTITFRFTFASDAIQTNKDGWMIGLVQTDGIFEGIDKIPAPGMLSASPNPGNGLFDVEMKDAFKGGEATVFSIKGRKVRSCRLTESHGVLDLRDLPDGLYILQYIHGKHYSALSLVKRSR